MLGILGKLFGANVFGSMLRFGGHYSGRRSRKAKPRETDRPWKAQRSYCKRYSHSLTEYVTALNQARSKNGKRMVA